MVQQKQELCGQFSSTALTKDIPNEHLTVCNAFPLVVQHFAIQAFITTACFFLLFKLKSLPISDIRLNSSIHLLQNILLLRICFRGICSRGTNFHRIIATHHSASSPVFSSALRLCHRLLPDVSYANTPTAFKVTVEDY